ncbi:DUF6308 family protein, partial [Micrococcus sp. GbtcB5]|uniref:DUF6308 family protein n=1 Tax=Micrococcus sp. GbtcB5 TaxID=2824750 RepID=UPI0034CFD264
MGPPIASKLLARKRPRLFPIIDVDLRQTVSRETLRDGYRGRQMLHEALAAEDKTLWKRRLGSYRSAASWPSQATV